MHSAVLVEELTRDVTPIPGVPTQGTVTYHDPCYLGRYAQTVDEPRALLERVGGDRRRAGAQPRRTRSAAAPAAACCSRSTRQGSASARSAIEQLPATGAGTIVMACPFCSIMLKGAQASADKAGATGQADGDDRPDVLRRRSPARRPPGAARPADGAAAPAPEAPREPAS